MSPTIEYIKVLFPCSFWFETIEHRIVKVNVTIIANSSYIRYFLTVGFGRVDCDKFSHLQPHSNNVLEPVVKPLVLVEHAT